MTSPFDERYASRKPGADERNADAQSCPACSACVRAHFTAVSRSAHAWATPRSGEVMPENVAQPPFSM
jgi:hypothetical protein